MGKVTDKGMQAALKGVRVAQAKAEASVRTKEPMKPAPVATKAPPAKPTPMTPKISPKKEREPAYITARKELGWQGTPKSKGIASDIDKEYRELRRKGKDVVGVLKEKFYDPAMSVFGEKK